MQLGIGRLGPVVGDKQGDAGDTRPWQRDVTAGRVSEAIHTRVRRVAPFPPDCRHLSHHLLDIPPASHRVCVKLCSESACKPQNACSRMHSDRRHWQARQRHSPMLLRCCALMLGGKRRGTRSTRLSSWCLAQVPPRKRTARRREA